MKRHIYVRVSTGKQTFDRQMVGIRSYFAEKGIDIEKVESIVTEHISGGKSYEDRKLKDLLNRCESGDIIYAASTDRLGRSFSDMIKLMAEAKERGIKIVACKQKLSLDDDSPVTKILLSIMTIMDEDERERASDRNIEKAAWQKEQIAKYGYFIVEKGDNKGKRCTHLGRPADENGQYDMSKANEAAAKSHKRRAEEWRRTSEAYADVKRWWGQGQSREWIIEEFNARHAKDPKKYATRDGKPMNAVTLSRWLKEMGSQQEAMRAAALS